MSDNTESDFEDQSIHESDIILNEEDYEGIYPTEEPIEAKPKTTIDTIREIKQVTRDIKILEMKIESLIKALHEDVIELKDMAKKSNHSLAVRGPKKKH